MRLRAIGGDIAKQSREKQSHLPLYTFVGIRSAEAMIPSIAPSGGLVPTRRHEIHVDTNP
jgi:hypothetical protein